MTPKSYKREIAGAMLVFLAAFFIAGVWYPEAQRTAEFLTTPILLTAAGAFGLQSYATQVRS